MSIESKNDQQNARLALKLVAMAVVIFLITLWKFRPV
jgi:ABC-type anion transport system duplicated permease subunit